MGKRLIAFAAITRHRLGRPIRKIARRNVDERSFPAYDPTLPKGYASYGPETQAHPMWRRLTGRRDRR